MATSSDLIPVGEFLREARKRGINISRRTLQYYASPALRLLPPPTYVGGHKAHLLASLLDRLELVWMLNRRYELPLRHVRVLLDRLEAGGHAWAANHRYLTRDDLLGLLRSDRPQSVTLIRLVLLRALGIALGQRSPQELVKSRDPERMKNAAREAREQLKNELDRIPDQQVVLLLAGIHRVNP